MPDWMRPTPPARPAPIAPLQAVPAPQASMQPPTQWPGAPTPGLSSHALVEIKSRVHRQLLQRLNLSSLDTVDKEQVVSAIRRVVHELVADEATPLNFEEREELVRQVVDEIFGLGPLEPLLKDPTVSDILVNTSSEVYVERNGRLEKTDVRFQDDRHLLQVIDRIVSTVGRRIDDSSPMVDARLPDGSRVNAVIPPVAIDGPHLSIRKFKRDVLSGEELVRKGSLTPQMLELLRACVIARMNVIVSGSTGAGKTTLLNMLSSFIPHNERVVTIEDSAELQLRQPHVVRMETRPANIEGKGEIVQRQLVRNALRMRPERIILGEVRGEEAIDMLQAMNTGHNGSLTTLHANTPRDAITRLETMVSMSNLSLPDRVVRRQISSAIHLIVQVTRLSDGTRKVEAISEVLPTSTDVVELQDIFVFDRTGVDPSGRVSGHFRPTGVRPNFLDQLRIAGVPLPPMLFA
ncbi:MAG TPA: CpaF family protein [Longimicrobiales bacterium]|nr:CpaF family protein [Longimicrobiales bacterium]